MPHFDKKQADMGGGGSNFHLQGFSCYTIFLKKVHEPLVLLIKVQKNPLNLSWKVQKSKRRCIPYMYKLRTKRQSHATQTLLLYQRPRSHTHAHAYTRTDSTRKPTCFQQYCLIITSLYPPDLIDFLLERHIPIFYNYHWWLLHLCSNFINNFNRSEGLAELSG